MMFSVKDKCIIITGAGGVIGSAIAVTLAKAGARLAVHLSTCGIRVNAIAPGFFLTEQNRFLLYDEATGELTPRGKRIIDHTPLGKLGNPEDLVSSVIWLLSDSSSFVTGAVIPVDGGFNAYNGI